MASLVSSLDSVGNFYLTGLNIDISVPAGGSLLFSGAQYTQTTGSSGAISSAFSFEAWIYITSISATQQIVFSTNTTNGPVCQFNNAGFSIARGISGGSGTIDATFAYTFALNTWYHVVWSRSGTGAGQAYGLVNGSLISTGTASFAYLDQTIRLGASSGVPGLYFSGYLTNARFVNGSTAYAAGSYTVPTTNLPRITNAIYMINVTSSATYLTDSSTINFTTNQTGGVTYNALSPYGLTSLGNTSSDFDEVTKPVGVIERQYANGIHQISGIYDEVTIPDLQYSTLFNGSGNYLSTLSTTAFDFSTGDFTLEAWIYPIDAGRTADASKFGGIITQYVSASVTNSWYFGIGISGGVFSSITFNSSDVTRVNATGLSYALNTWYHVACVRYSGTMTIYINGVSVGSASYSSAISYNASASVNIGRSAYADLYENWLRGYISNARIVKGTAVYTSNFTPPTQTLVAIANTSLLTCQNSTFVDNSNNNFAITNTGSPKTISFPVGYCNSFNGSGQYLTVASNTALQLTTGDFTIEGWIYTNSFTNSPSIYYKRATRTIFAHVGIGTISAGRLALLVSNAAGSAWTINDSSSMPVMSTNTWYHFALVRNGNNIQMYLNGTQYINSTAITSATTIRDDGSAVSIGAAAADGGGISLPYDGYISNLRIVKGTALYANTGFIPTPPLTAVGNTVLLTCQSSTIIDNSLNAFAITNTGGVITIGPPVISPEKKLYADGTYQISGQFDEFTMRNNSYSASLNGSTQYFTIAGDATKFGFGTGDFTIEFWVYPTALGSRRDFIDMGDASTSGPLIWFDGTSSLQYYYLSTRITASGVLTVNTWHHIALSRSSGSSRLFVNGVQVGSTYADTLNYSGTGTIYIGRNQGASLGFVAGYMSNLRIVKGTGLYTTNFNPSLKPLNAIANTSLLTLQNSTIFDNSIYAANVANVGPVTTIISTLPFF